MAVLIENELAYEFPFAFADVAEAVIKAVLATERCPYQAEVNIILVDDENIRSINAEFRDLNQATDVLSFPMIEFTKPAKYDIITDGEGTYFNPESDELMLGDIIISVPRMNEQAIEYGHSTKREYAFLITHSMLHLLGYDHMEVTEAKIMEAKQAIILEQLRITR